MENEIVKKETIQSLMNSDYVKNRFAEILGKNSSGFVASVVNISSNTALKECEPRSVLSCAIVAATLQLPIDPNLSFAAIIPYKNKDGNKAQFQIMYKGLIQLAIRSGQFKTINVTEIYEGEIEKNNILTGEITFNGEGKKSNQVIGFAAYFSLINGFEKTLYMTVEQIKAHGKKYSKSYANQYGQWATNFEAMAKKTVLKMLLSKYAPLSVEMQKATQLDQAVINTNNETLDVESFDYVDNEPQKEIQTKSELEILTDAIVLELSVSKLPDVEEIKKECSKHTKAKTWNMEVAAQVAFKLGIDTANL